MSAGLEVVNRQARVVRRPIPRDAAERGGGVLVGVDFLGPGAAEVVRRWPLAGQALNVAAPARKMLEVVVPCRIRLAAAQLGPQVG